MAAEDWTYNRLSATLKKGEFQSLYLLFGDESFLFQRAKDEIVEAILPEAQGLRDFNLNVFDAVDCDVNRVRDALETLPMMAPARVVVLQNAHELKDKEWDILQPMIDAPPMGVSFVVTAVKIDKRKRFWKRFLESGVSLECKRPYDNQIPEWIEFLAKKHRVRFSHDAASALQQVVGSTLSDLDGEIQKLSIYCGGRKTGASTATIDVSVEDVLKVASPVRIESVFDFAEAVGHGDRVRALYCLANLLDQGQNEVGILALVARHIRILRTFVDGVREGLSGPKLAARAGVSPYFARDYAEQAKVWTPKKIELTLEALVDTDKALKSSTVGSHIWLENLILRVC